MTMINLIVHADKPGDALPVNHLATTIQDYLVAVDPGTQTLVKPVNNAYDWLTEINVLNTQPDLRIKRFFSISHAWELGLQLGEMINNETEQQLDMRIEQLYGYADVGGSDQDAPILPKGSDDHTHFDTYQLRVSNLKLLPDPCIKYLRKTFTNAEEVFLLGCNTANEDWREDNHPTICDVFAEVIEKVVYGANYYSKVFGYTEAQLAGPVVSHEWGEITLNYADPKPDYPVLLVPGAWGSGQLLKYLSRSFPESGQFELPPFGIYSPPPVVDNVDSEKHWTDLFDLVGLYSKFMTPCYPKRSLFR